LGLALLGVVMIANALAQGIGLAARVAWTNAGGSVGILILVLVGAALSGAVGAAWGYSIALALQLTALILFTSRAAFTYVRG
jgi:hypothetical protein